MKQKTLKRRKRQQQKGFTLIELLVVISIISLLASVLLVAMNGARQKARTAKRVGDLKQIATAMELYYADNGSYPNTQYGVTTPPPPWWRSQCLWTGNGYMQGGLASNQVVWDTTLNKGIVPTYIAKFPADPSMDAVANTGCFSYTSNGTDYKLMDWGITDATLAQIHSFPTFMDQIRNDVGLAQCGWGGDTALSLAVWSSGARCW